MLIIISNFIVLCILYYLGYHLLTPKHENLLINIFIFFIIFLLCNLVNYSGAASYKAFILFILYLFFIFLLFKDDIKKTFYTLLVFFIIATFSELFIYFLMNILFELNPNTSLMSVKYAVSLLLSHILSFVLSYLYIKLQKDIDTYTLPKYAWIIFILPITTIILIVNIDDYYDLMRNNVFIFIVILGLFISNFITIYISWLVVKSMTMKKELENLNIQKQFISNHFSSHFDYLHTIINRLKDISNLTNDSTGILVKNEIEDLLNFSYEQFNLLYTNSIALNTVINNKIDDFHKYNIKFEHTIMYIDFDYLDFVTQIDLFTYLIDIGIEANKNSTVNKNIILKSKKQNNQLIISETFTVSTHFKQTEKIRNKIQHILNKNKVNISIKEDIDKVIVFIIIFEK